MSEQYFERSQEPDFSEEIPAYQPDVQPTAETPEYAPLQTHEDWLHKVQEMEGRNTTVRRALEAQGLDPDTDPDYQFFLGELNLARTQLRGFAAMRMVDRIDNSESHY